MQPRTHEDFQWIGVACNDFAADGRRRTLTAIFLFHFLSAFLSGSWIAIGSMQSFDDAVSKYRSQVPKIEKINFRDLIRRV
jgi:hypothetical protein